MSELSVGDGRTSGDYTRPVASGSGFREWQQPSERLERAFVLAGGGATGIAWEAGIILGLRDGGIDVRDADTMIGTSAGSMVAAHLRIGTDEGNAFARIREGAPSATTAGSAPPTPPATSVRSCTPTPAAAAPSSARPLSARARRRRRSGSRRSASGSSGSRGPNGACSSPRWMPRPAPRRVRQQSGVPRARRRRQLCRAGVFPAVEIAGRRYVDGGLRSIANADLAAGHRRVLALAPYPVGPHLRDLPAVQLRALRPKARTHLVVPDARDVWAMGANPLDMSRGAGTFETARSHGLRIAPRVGEIWAD